MDVIISLEPEDLKLPEGTEEIVKNAAAVTGPLYGVENGEVSITLTNNEYIHKLNKQYCFFQSLGISIFESSTIASAFFWSCKSWLVQIITSAVYVN